MEDKLFAELEQSLQEAVSIEKGEIEPARVTIIEDDSDEE